MTIAREFELTFDGYAELAEGAVKGIAGEVNLASVRCGKAGKQVS